MSTIRTPRSAGFTIVELLIVIVIIAILAAITIVAYNGIQARARASAASSAVTQAKKKLELYKIDNGSYPTSGNLASAGITDTTSATYQYTSTTGASYCLTATNSNVSYYVDSATQPTPTQGGCAGHGQGGVAAITNYVSNPSVRDSATGWNAITGYTITRVADAQAGSGYAAEKPLGADQIFFDVVGLPNSAQNAMYAIDLWLSPSETASTASVRLWAEKRASPYTQWLSQYVTITKTKQRFYASLTIPNGEVNGAIGARNAGSFTVRASAAFVGIATGQPAFADGNSPNWVWNGAANASTSTGPPL